MQPRFLKISLFAVFSLCMSCHGEFWDLFQGHGDKDAGLPWPPHQDAGHIDACEPIFDGGPPPNHAPYFTSATSTQAYENQQTWFYQANAYDPDLDTIRYAILASDDAALLKIDPSSGQLSFREAPNFEVPSDKNGDNIYQVTIMAIDPDSEAAYIDLSIEILDQTRDVTFRLYQHIQGTNGITTGDVNGDDIEDIIVSGLCNSDCKGIYVYLGQPEGDYGEPILGWQTTSNNSFPFLTAGDINNDGMDDLFACNSTSDFGSLSLISNGDGTFIQDKLKVISHCNYAAILDIKTDGYTDVITSFWGPEPRPAHVYLGDGTSLNGGFLHWCERCLPLSEDYCTWWTVHMSAADIDDDGLVEILTARDHHSMLWGLTLVSAKPSGEFNKSQRYFLNRQGVVTAIDDFDGDDLLDIFAILKDNSSNYETGVMLNLGDGTLSQPIIQQPQKMVRYGAYPADSRAFDTADINEGRLCRLGFCLRVNMYLS